MGRQFHRLILLVLFALSLTGCWGRIEVNDLALVSMMAIDKGIDAPLRVWVHIITPGTAGGGGGAPGGGGSAGSANISFVTMSAEGRTITEAYTRMQTHSSRRLFWAHMRVILIGEDLARAGLRPVTDFLTRDRELRLTNYMLVAKGDLTEFMASPVELERLPVEYLRELSISKIGASVNLLQFIDMMALSGADPILATAELVPPPPGATPGTSAMPGLAGAALFRWDKMVGALDASETRGLLWLRDEGQPGTVTLELPDIPGQISVKLLNSHVQRQARAEGGQITFYIRARTEGDVSDSQANIDLSDPKILDSINRALNKEIEERMEQAVAIIQELNVDAAGLGEIVHQQLPAVWRRVEKGWKEDGLSNARVVIEVDAQIRRTGLSGKPRGVPESELMKGE